MATNIFHNPFLRANDVPIFKSVLGEVNSWYWVLHLDLLYRPFDMSAHGRR